MHPNLFLPRSSSSFEPINTAVVVGSITIASALAISFLVRYFEQQHPLDAVPGPPPVSFLLGNVMQSKGGLDSWHTTTAYPEPYLNWIQTYGGAVHYRELSSHFVLFSDPKALQHIMVSNAANYPRHALIRNFVADRLLGVGLLSSVGAHHDQQRKMLNPHFTPSQIKTFIPIFDEMATNACNTTLHNAALAGTPVDMLQFFRRLTLAAIGRTVFGFDFDQHPDTIAAYEQMNAPLPLWIQIGLLFVPKFSFLPLPQLRAVQHAQHDLRRVILAIIDAKRASTNTGDASDLLDLMLPHSTPQEALVHIMTFMAAGHDTTSTGLSWVFGLLASKPAIVARIRDEVARVTQAFGAINSWESVHALAFTTAVVQEALRYRTVVPTLMRRVVDCDDHVPMSDGSHVFLPKGTTVEHIPAAMHMNPRYWARPEEFIPERFLDGSPEWLADETLRGTKSHAFIFMPFSIGVGSCIGQKLAMKEMSVFTAMFLSRYEFALVPPVDLKPRFTMAVILPAKLVMTVSKVVEGSAPHGA
ncbi:Aste57867_7522 [Aphanomyces stellatus]|uniref:Aste57867_7522 protein n=1 Tax=Aphanomyces stellatus TaxID=120398 RepID=A0A485KIF4_9STRA|nr:hypothetical protein As57867_007496 [Aphanomyces stellatus]VFT84431.1 Aste57867_7522 [Aphanomyces stellatus]